MARAVTALCCLIVAAGCAVPGSGADRPDLDALDVGSYSRTPMSAPPSTEQYGRTVASMRLGEAIIDPEEADPELTVAPQLFSAVPLPTAGKAAAFLSVPARAVLEKYGMVAGFAADGTDREVERMPAPGAARLLTVLLLAFPDPDSATRAAAEIDRVDAAVNPENVPVEVPGHPDAHGHWRPTVASAAFTAAQGSFVVSLLVGHTSPDLAVMTAVASRAFDAQSPRLREVAVTPPSELAALSLDPDGMVSRLAPKAPGRWPFPSVSFTSREQNAGWDVDVVPSGVVYGPRATRIVRAHSDSRPDLIAVNGMDMLMRYPDAATARRKFDDAVRATVEDDDAASPVAGVPDSSCGRMPDMGPASQLNTSCKVLYGRHLAVLYGRDEADLRRRAAAQFALLVNSSDDR